MLGKHSVHSLKKENKLRHSIYVFDFLVYQNKKLEIKTVLYLSR